MLIRAHEVVESHASARRMDGQSPTELSAMRVLQTIALLLIIPTIVAAQTQTRDRRSTDNPQTSRTESDAVRNRVVGPKASNHVDNQKSRPEAPNKSTQETNGTSQPSWGNTSVIVRPTQNASVTPISTATKLDTAQPKKLIQPTSLV